MIRYLLFVVCALALSACATAGKQTREVLDLPASELPRSAEAKAVPFINQTKNHCGPATLTMAMQSAGHNVSVDEIAPRVLASKASGTLQEDLVSASRREGMMAIPIEGMKSMLQEIAAGHPVIVLENLGFGFLSRWHYEIVFGYDLHSQELMMHSGHDANTRKYLNRFEWGWKQADYWGLVVLPPGELSASAGVLEHLRAAAGLEQADQNGAAEVAYKAILRRWPDHLAALIGLGNTAYGRGAFAASVGYLRRAVSLYPESEEARHNLTVAEGALWSSGVLRKSASSTDASPGSSSQPTSATSSEAIVQ